MEYPEDLRYTPQDEWVRREDDAAVIGITDYAQDNLSDIVYVELPEPGTRFGKGEACGVIESVKAVADLFAPVAGEVLERNGALAETPELVNASPYGEGWMLRLRMDDPSELETLLDARAYQAQLPEDA